MDELEARRDELIRTVGNLLHPSVPVSNNEDHNDIVRTVGDDAVNRTRYVPPAPTPGDRAPGVGVAMRGTGGPKTGPTTGPKAVGRVGEA
jgi:hypothetical protein